MLLSALNYYWKEVPFVSCLYLTSLATLFNHASLIKDLSRMLCKCTYKDISV